MHMFWISGNLNELEHPIAKVNSWYVCGCPIKQFILSKSSQAPFPCDVAEKCHLAEMLKSSLWWQKLKKVFFLAYVEMQHHLKNVSFFRLCYSKKKILELKL